MNDIAHAIDTTVETNALLMRSFDSLEFERIPSAMKWSRKEILGHLVDSAQNNLRRFVVGQYEHSPKISYAQDDWVRLQNYQSCNQIELIDLWILLNKQLCRTLRAMSTANYERTCDTGKASVELHTLKFLAEDYLAHMKHHLVQLSVNSHS